MEVRELLKKAIDNVANAPESNLIINSYYQYIVTWVNNIDTNAWEHTFHD